MLGARFQFAAKSTFAGLALTFALTGCLFAQSALIAVTTTVSTQLQGGSAFLTATLTAASPGPPITGTVTFYSGSASLGSAPVQAAAGGGAASATASLAVAATAVTSTVSAYYSGDKNYAAGPPFVLTAPALETLLQTNSFQLNIVPTNGFTGTVNLSCSGVPTYLNCTITPPAATIANAHAASAQADLSLAPCAKYAWAVPGTLPNWPWLPLACLLLGLAVLVSVLVLRRRRWSWLALLAALAVGSAACGGVPSCPYSPGQGAVTVVATSGSYTVKQSLTYFIPVTDPI
ncbi:MAG: Ig-like domain-containing protein [Terriglobales bacterium]